MKVILAATDFSNTARNAINYAAELARRSGARLVLFHAYHPPVLYATELPILTPSNIELERDSLRLLRRTRNQLLLKHGARFKVSVECRYGLAADVIKEFAESNHVDLIVLGTRGGGLFEQKILGSVTTSVIRHTHIPVLCVPRNVKYNPVKKIALAANGGNIHQPGTFEVLKSVARSSRAHIYIVNVLTPDQKTPELEEAVTGLQLEHLLQDQKHSFCAVTDSDVVHGINQFVSKEQMDMLVMMPADHSFFSSLLIKRNTESMAFHTKVPMLSIHQS